MAMTDDFSSEQFALRWNNFSYNLSSGFSSHLSTKNLVDVTIAVEGQLLEAHKLILSVCSPYFENIFKTNPCSHPVVILQDMKYAEVDALLKFMYQGEISVKQEDLARFLKVAEVLKVKGLTLDPAVLQSTPNNSDNSLPQNTLKLQTKESVLIDNDDSKEDLKIIGKEKKYNQTDNVPKKSSKRIRRCSPISNNSSDKIPINQISPEIKYANNNLANECQNICTNNNISAEYSNRMETSNNDGSIDLTKDDDDDEFDNNTESSSDNIIDNSSEKSSKVEPVTYRLSARGRPQIIHDGYIYNLTSRSVILNRSHYRCAEQHRGCRGKCAVIAERFMPTAVNEHNHPPGYQTETDYKKKNHQKLNEDS